MGVNPSIPTITPDMTNFDIHGINIGQIPEKIPPNKLITVNLERTGLNEPEFPKGMNHLTTLILSYNKIKTLTPHQIKRLKGYSKLQTLDLSNNLIENLPKELNTLTQITNLNLFANKLTEFHYSNKHLKSLNLGHNGLHNIPDIDVKELQKFTFDWNDLVTLDLKMTSLTSLSLVCVSLEKIAPSFNFPNLESLDIRMNRLMKIPNFQETTPKLKVLDISDNFITDFPKVPNTIEKLFIKSNSIRSIPDDITQLTRLQVFNFSNNLIKIVPRIPSVILKIFGSSNRVVEFAPINAPNLTDCCLDNNDLSTMPSVIDNKIIFYNMNHNHITDIRLNYISPNVALIELVDNDISSIPPEIFNLPYLEHLALMHNKITQIPQQIVNSKKLKRLNLSFNKIKTIPPLPPTLVEFHLAGNQIEEITSTISSSNVTFLDVDLNRLTSIPLLPRVKNIYASQNMINQFPLFSRDIYAVDLSYNQLTTVPALVYEHLYDFDISHNNIDKVPDFTNCPEISIIKLAENPRMVGELHFFGSHSSAEVPAVVPQRLPPGLRPQSPPPGLRPPVPPPGCPANAVMPPAVTPVTKVTPNLKPRPRSTVVKGGKSSDMQQIDICDTQVKISNSNNIREILFTETSSRLLHGKKLIFGSSCGVAEMRGVRITQEDSVYICARTSKGHSVYAVFDGHGGATTSLYCTLVLKKVVNDPNFVFTEQYLREQIRNLQKQLEERHYSDGSTMALAVVSDEENKIMIAHVGDARVLVTNDIGRLRFATPDHKPSSRSEFERIHASGGRVTKGRVNSILAVARSLGDLHIAESLSAEPDITTYVIKTDDKWLYIACDGVFDVLSNDYVAKIGGEIDDPSLLAYTIRNTAFGSFSQDNITSIAVNLHKRKEDPTIMAPK